MKNGTMKQGFTIIEVLTAVFLLTVGAVGAFGVTNQALTITSILSERLVAAYLAQEGLEVLRNIRDSNWLEQLSDPSVLWDDGIPFGAGGNCGVDYTSNSCPPAKANEYLWFDPASGTYSYVRSGSVTSFKRNMRIQKSDLSGDGEPDLIRVTANVIWEGRGRTNTFSATEHLYNWR